MLGFITDSDETMLIKILSPLAPLTSLYVFATKHAFGLLIEPGVRKVESNQRGDSSSSMQSLSINEVDTLNVVVNECRKR